GLRDFDIHNKPRPAADIPRPLEGQPVDRPAFLLEEGRQPRLNLPVRRVLEYIFAVLQDPPPLDRPRVLFHKELPPPSLAVFPDQLDAVVGVLPDLLGREVSGEAVLPGEGKPGAE